MVFCNNGKIRIFNLHPFITINIVACNDDDLLFLINACDMSIQRHQHRQEKNAIVKNLTSCIRHTRPSIWLTRKLNCVFFLLYLVRVDFVFGFLFDRFVGYKICYFLLIFKYNSIA